MKNVVILDHPLVSHKITLLRDKNTNSKQFRELVEEISMLITYESLRNLPTEEIEVETPICKTRSKVIAGKDIAIVPILRAGLGMTSGILALLPTAKVGHIGLYRDHETLEPHEYYCKLPEDIAERDVILLDPMLATGGSASAAVNFLKQRGVQHIKLMSILAAPEGIERVTREHPDLLVYVACVDEKLNEHGYIVPGLGDAGDRRFGTK